MVSTLESKPKVSLYIHVDQIIWTKKSSCLNSLNFQVIYYSSEVLRTVYFKSEISDKGQLKCSRWVKWEPSRNIVGNTFIVKDSDIDWYFTDIMFKVLFVDNYSSFF